jgi:hypothetical protein
LLTVTVKEHVDLLPEASMTEQFTVVVPTAKFVQGAGEDVTVPTPGQLSVAVTVKQTFAVF